MSIALSSIGVRVYYTEADIGKVPSDDMEGVEFSEIPEVKSIPSLSPAPDTLETTPLSNEEYKTYINGLKDLGGALEFTANLTQDLLDMWNGKLESTGDAVMEKFKKITDGTTTGKELVLCVVHPRLDRAVYFPFEPARIGLPEIAVNSVLEATISITPIGEVVWGKKPTPELIKTVYRSAERPLFSVPK